MEKVLRIPADENSCDWLMAAARFEYFKGGCSLSMSYEDSPLTRGYWMSVGDQKRVETLNI